MGIGSLRHLSLADARKKALDLNQRKLDGVDPIQHREAQRAERMKAMTFKQAGDAYLAAHDEAWRHEKTRHQARAHLNTYVYPVIGSLPVASIETAHVRRVIDRITGKPKTAQRVRGRIAEVMDWATAHELRKGENPARWKGHLRT